MLHALTIPATLAATLALGAAHAPVQDEDFERRLAEYEQEVERRALLLRTLGREQLADSGEQRALAILVRDYDDAEKPVEFVRSTLVAMGRDKFDHVAYRDTWRAWRLEHDDETDAWLWFNALLIEGDGDGEAWRSVALGDESAPLRAAALSAGAALERGAVLDEEHLALLHAVVADLPKRGVERAVLLEAALATVARAEPSDDYDPLLLAVVDALEAKGTDERSAVVLSRELARALGCENIGPRPDGWRELIERTVEERDRPVPPRYLVALDHGFFGLQDHGRRICFVIDASDSMLKPLTPRERSELQASTGDDGESGAPVDSRSRRVELRIDWSRIETRFDAARAMLALAVSDLSPDDSFAVVLFGDRAETLRSTRQLEAAKPKVVEDVLEELDRIRPGQPTPERPDGTLYGKTNLHGALRLAHRLTDGKRLVDDHADVSEEAFEGGCDTIFLLSDGAPNWDDFEQVDVNESGVIGDPEAGRTIGESNTGLFTGPFALRRYLLADLERHALLRRATIHAVGMGEADADLLRRIAALGGGELVMIGQR